MTTVVSEDSLATYITNAVLHTCTLLQLPSVLNTGHMTQTCSDTGHMIQTGVITVLSKCVWNYFSHTCLCKLDHTIIRLWRNFSYFCGYKINLLWHFRSCPIYLAVVLKWKESEESQPHWAKVHFNLRLDHHDQFLPLWQLCTKHCYMCTHKYILGGWLAQRAQAFSYQQGYEYWWGLQGSIVIRGHCQTFEVWLRDDVINEAVSA